MIVSLFPVNAIWVNSYFEGPVFGTAIGSSPQQGGDAYHGQTDADGPNDVDSKGPMLDSNISKHIGFP